MRTINFVEETRRKTPALSDDELVCIGMICATSMTLLALIELFRLSLIMG